MALKALDVPVSVTRMRCQHISRKYEEKNRDQGKRKFIQMGSDCIMRGGCRAIPLEKISPSEVTS